MLSMKKAVSATLAATIFFSLLIPTAAATEDVAEDQETAVVAAVSETNPEISEEAVAEDAEVGNEETEETTDAETEEKAEAEVPQEEKTVNIVVNGEPSDFRKLAFIHEGTTYVPLRDVCNALGATSISYDAETAAARVLAPGLEMSIPINEHYIVANDRYLYAEYGVMMKNDRTMVPVRTISVAFGASISWDGETGTVEITSGETPIAPGSEFYDEKDLYWMTRIINAEAGGESFLGKLAVGNVIMNRVASPSFPSTVYDVIFDRRSGVQFTPTANGAIYKKPRNPECEIAAKIALEGTQVVGDALYFSSAYLSCWASRNRPFLTQIGGHAFYA